MELRQLRYFVKARELMNFTEAAAGLNISQSTLSQQIRQLENELGIPLFDRIGKRIALTEAGKLFYDYALKTVASANSGFELLKDLQELKTGNLTIGVSPGLRHLFTPVLVKFMQRYPLVKMQVIFGSSDELKNRLLNHQTDLLLTFEDLMMHEHLEYQPLFQSALCLAIARKHPLAQKSNITLKEVAELPLVLAAKGHSTREFIDDAFARHRLNPQVAAEINDIPTLIELVKTGKWHTVLTQSSISSSDKLVAVPITGRNIRRAMLIRLQGAYETKAQKEFRRLILEESKNPAVPS